MVHQFPVESKAKDFHGVPVKFEREVDVLERGCHQAYLDALGSEVSQGLEIMKLQPHGSPRPQRPSAVGPNDTVSQRQGAPWAQSEELSFTALEPVSGMAQKRAGRHREGVFKGRQVGLGRGATFRGCV